MLVVNGFHHLVSFRFFFLLLFILYGGERRQIIACRQVNVFDARPRVWVRLYECASAANSSRSNAPNQLIGV